MNVCQPPMVLSIAATDTSSGAGIQADIKTLSHLGVRGCQIVTAVTSQNSFGVKSVYPIPVDIIETQCDMVFSDYSFDVVKIGMLYSEETIRVISKYIARHQLKVVLDPIWMSTSGTSLLTQTAEKSLILELFPYVSYLTPNAIELTRFLGSLPIEDKVRRLFDRGISDGIIIKGGHQSAPNLLISDQLYLRDSPIPIVISHPRIDTFNTHGTGCVFSSAFSAFLALGSSPIDAFRKAVLFLTDRLQFAKTWHYGQSSYGGFI